MKRIKAVFDGETFRPLTKVQLPKGTEVEIILKPTITTVLQKYQLQTDQDIDEITKRVRSGEDKKRTTKFQKLIANPIKVDKVVLPTRDELH